MPALYKFITNPDDIGFLLNGSIKFTPISELNDPSELVPKIDADAIKASLERLRRDGYSDTDMTHLHQQGNLMRLLAPKRQAISVPPTKDQATAQIQLPVYDNTPWLESRLEATANEISAKVGLFCLTERFDSLPMWAHYASNAAGLAVEFQDLDAVFQGDDTGILRRPIPVRYEREKSGVTFDPQSHQSLFFTKFQDWSYEEEVRVVLPLVECDASQLPDGRCHYLFNIPKKHVARIILGWRMTVEVANVIQEVASSISPGVQVVQARILRGKVQLDG